MEIVFGDEKSSRLLSVSYPAMHIRERCVTLGEYRCDRPADLLQDAAMFEASLTGRQTDTAGGVRHKLLGCFDPRGVVDTLLPAVED